MAIVGDVIFKKGTCQRKQLFDLLISLMQSNGWTLESSTSQYWYLSSKGVNKDTYIGIRLSPFDYNGTSSSYDCRTTIYSNANYRYYYKENNTNVLIGRVYNPLPFVGGRSVSSASSADSATSTDLTTTVEYYYYIDADRVIFITYLPNYSTKGGCFFLGKPFECYTQETLLPYHTGIIEATNSQWQGNSSPIVMNIANPINGVGTAPSFEYVSFIQSPKPTDTQNAIQLSEIYFGHANYGLRGKLGGIYLLPTSINSFLVYGDTIEVTVGEEVHTYAYIPIAGDGSSNYSSPFEGDNVAVRIA